MVAGANILVDAEFLPHDTLARPDRLGEYRAHAALLVQHAFGGSDDDLRSRVLVVSASRSVSRIVATS